MNVHPVFIDLNKKIQKQLFLLQSIKAVVHPIFIDHNKNYCSLCYSELSNIFTLNGQKVVTFGPLGLPNIFYIPLLACIVFIYLKKDNQMVDSRASNIPWLVFSTLKIYSISLIKLTGLLKLDEHKLERGILKH